jgi:FAD/FMN-containing dehydrogenase
VFVNDIHSQLNNTLVAELVSPGSVDEVVSLVREASAAGRATAIAGLLLDMGRLDAVHAFDPALGLIEVGAGMQWPALIEWLWTHQGRDRAWGIVQKQTGADRLSIGGAVSANVHGRGLTLRPLVQDVEALTLVDAAGTVRRVSRSENADLFPLVVGGYGLFGVITSVQLRLAPRRKLRRLVTIERADTVMERLTERVVQGSTWGLLLLPAGAGRHAD